MNANERLDEYLNGKTVAYVCPSNHIVGHGLGTYIDSFDVVIRCNQHWNIPSKCVVDFGKRTDILVTNLGGYSVNEIHRNIGDNLQYIKSMKYMVSLVAPQTALDLLSNAYHFDLNNLIVFSQEDREICQLPHTGLIGLEFLLKKNVKKMFVTGMSFYNMGEFGRIWYDEFFDEQAKADELTSKSDVINRTISKTILDMPGSHNIQDEIRYFRDVMMKKHKDKLELDFYLKEKFGSVG